MSHAHLLDNYEARNAQLWDTETIVSEQTEDNAENEPTRTNTLTPGQDRHEQHHPTSTYQYPSFQTPPDQQQPRAQHSRPVNFATAPAPQSTPRSSSLPTAAQNRDSRGRNRTNTSPSRPNQPPPRRTTQTGSRYNPQRGPPHASIGGQKDDKWAPKIPLVTTRQQEVEDKKAAKDAEEAVYLGKPDDPIYVQVTGYYLWPSRYESPYDLLGEKLDNLQRLPPLFQVKFKWIGEKRVFQISSTSLQDGEKNVCDAVVAIRRIVQSAKALAASAPPLRIVEPPSVQTIRHYFQPIFPPDIPVVDDLIAPKPAVVGFILGGPKLLPEERSAWRSQREMLQKDNHDLLRSYLTKYLHCLSPVQDWMRLRLHFGNLQLPTCPANFKESRLGFNEFSDMLKPTSLKTSFDKEIDDASIALEIRAKIADHPDKYCPADPMIATLKEVPAKHTMVMFARKDSGPEYRIEADIDLVSNSNAGQYQFGTTKYYLNNQRNKHLEIVSVDVDKGLDWILEVITDSSLSSVPDLLQKYVSGCLDAKTTEREDALGLKFPGVKPRHPVSVSVRSVAVRSSFQFLNRDSNFVVDVSIYREWNRTYTNPEPKLMTSVSMFHRGWESAMEAIASTANRDWDTELRTFFPDHKGKDGLRVFLDDVQWVQELLSRTAKDIKSNYVQASAGVESSPEKL